MDVRAQTLGKEEVKEIQASPPEYIRRRCKLCGDFYISAKEYVEVGFCRGCAEANGWYVSRNRIGVYRVDDQQEEDQIEELEEENKKD